MVAVANRRQLTVAERPGVLAKTFWTLAESEPVAGNPLDVARCAVYALEALDCKDHGALVTASTLTFLLRLESDHMYASPEQARGDRTNQRSLVFTVGVLVFEKITGHHPFGASPGRAKTDEDVEDMVPPELRAVLETAMAPFPADRWSSLSALRRELQRFVDREGSCVVAMPRRRRRSVPPPCPGSAVRRVVGSRAAPLPQESPDVPPAQARRRVTQPPPMPAAAEEPPLVDVALLEEPRDRGGLARSAVLMVAGAVVALLAAWWIQQPGDAIARAPANEKAAVEVEPTPLPALVVEVTLDELVVQEPTVEVPAVEEPVAVPGPVAAPEAELDSSAVFDADRAGEAALAAMRPCFSDQRQRRGVELSASLRFAKADGLSNRVYFAAGQQVDSAERECIRGHLTGLSGGAAPDRNAIVSYTFWLSAEGGRFWAKTQR
jgi:hypothetical protein